MEGIFGEVVGGERINFPGTTKTQNSTRVMTASRWKASDAAVCFGASNMRVTSTTGAYFAPYFVPASALSTVFRLPVRLPAKQQDLIVLPLAFSHLGATTVNRQRGSPEEVSWSIQKRERDHLSIDLSNSITRSRSRLSFHIVSALAASTFRHLNDQTIKWEPCYPTPGDGINRSIHFKRASLLKHLIEDIPIGRRGEHLPPVRPLQRRPKTWQAKIRNDKK